MKRKIKQAFSILLSVLLVIGALPLSALAAETPSTNWQDYDSDDDGKITANEVAAFLNDNIKLENDVLSWPNLSGIQYNLGYQFTGMEVYLVQGEYVNGSSKYTGIAGVDVAVNGTESVNLAELATQETISDSMTYGKVQKTGMNAYDPTESVTVLVAVTYSYEYNGNTYRGYACEAVIPGYNLGVPGTWGNNKHSVILGKAPQSHVTSSGEMQQAVPPDETIDAVTFTPVDGYTYTGVDFSSVAAGLTDTGISASLVDGVLTINGTPTKDISLGTSQWPSPVLIKYNVNLGSLPTGVTSSDDLTQSNISVDKAFTDVFLSAQDGYILSENYANALNSGILNDTGLSASYDADSGKITISGTPTTNVDLSAETWPEVSMLFTIKLFDSLPTGLVLASGSGAISQTVANGAAFQKVILKPDTGYRWVSDATAKVQTWLDTNFDGMECSGTAAANDGNIEITLSGTFSSNQVLDDSLQTLVEKFYHVKLGTKPQNNIKKVEVYIGNALQESDSLEFDIVAGMQVKVVFTPESGYAYVGTVDSHKEDLRIELLKNHPDLSINYSLMASSVPLTFTWTPKQDVNLSFQWWDPALIKYNLNLGTAPSHVTTEVYFNGEKQETTDISNLTVVKDQKVKLCFTADTGYEYSGSEISTKLEELQAALKTMYGTNNLTNLATFGVTDGKTLWAEIKASKALTTNYVWFNPVLVKYFVNLGTAPSGVTVSGSLNQTDISVENPFEDITISAVEGYIFPADFANQLNNGILKNTGLTATKSADGSIKIGGTPTKITNVTSSWPEMIRVYTVDLGGLPANTALAASSGAIKQENLQTKDDFTEIVLTPANGYAWRDDALTIFNKSPRVNVAATIEGNYLEISYVGNTLADVDNDISTLNLTVKVYEIDLGTLPDGLNIESGSVTATVQEGSGFSLVLKVHETKALSNTYISDLNTQLAGTGLTAEYNEVNHKITVSGTPTSDVDSITWSVLDGVQAVVEDKNGNKIKYDSLSDAFDRVNSEVGAGNSGGDYTISIDNTVTSVIDATLPTGATIEDKNDNSYTAVDGNATVSVDANGNVTISGGKLEVSEKGELGVTVPAGGNNYEVNGTDDNSSDFIVNADNQTVTIKDKNGSVSSTTSEEDLTFTAGVANSEFPLDGSKLNNNGDKLIVGKNTTVDVTTNVDSNSVKVDKDNQGDVTIEKGAPSTATIDKSGDKVTINGKEYEAKSDNTVIKIDADGNVILEEGAVGVQPDDSISVKTEDGTYVDVENPVSNSNEIIVTAPAGTVAVKKDDTVSIGDTDYTVKKDTIIKTGEDGNTITSGKVELDKDENITGGESSAEIANPSDTVDITVEPDSTNEVDIITVPDGGKVEINDTEYTNPTDSPAGDDLVLEVDKNGNVNIKDGNVELDKNESITVNGTEIKNTDENTTIIVGRDETTGNGTINIEEGGAFTVGDSGTVIDPNKDMQFEVDTDGNIIIELPTNDDSITIDGVDYTGGSVTIIVDKDGNISQITGDYTVSIPDDALSDPSFSYPLRPGESVKIGDYIYTAPDNPGSKTGDVTVSARVDENGNALNPTVTIKNSGETVNVALADDETVNTDYTSASDDAKFAMSQNDTDTTKIDLLDNGKTPNSLIRFTDDITHTVNGIDYTGESNLMSPDYTIGYGESDDRNSNSIAVSVGTKVTVEMNRDDTLSIEDNGKVNGKDFIGPVPVKSTADNTILIIDNTGSVDVSGKDSIITPVTDSNGIVTGIEIGKPSSGGGSFGDDISDEDISGVSEWLNTSDHIKYLGGYPNGSFNPDGSMTRAEVAQMFYNLLLDKNVSVTAAFSDVPKGAWYERAVNVLASIGIIHGVGNDKFEPNRSITRAEFTALALRFAHQPNESENVFTDVYKSDWFYKYVVGATQYDWINGYPDGTFRPKNSITRAEATVMVNNILGRSADEDYVSAHKDELTSFTDIKETHWAYYHIVEATNYHDYNGDGNEEIWLGIINF